MLTQSYTAVVERNQVWSGAFATEPYEAAWAHEAIFFIRVLEARNLDRLNVYVQISPDGMHWCDEGTHLSLPVEAEQVVFCRVAHFGGWLRLHGTLPEGAELRVIVYLSLKA